MPDDGGGVSRCDAEVEPVPVAGPLVPLHLGPDSTHSRKLARKLSPKNLQKLELNKMVNSSNGPAAKLIAWSAERIVFDITKN